MPPLRDAAYVMKKLAFMERRSIFPHGLRYLWTDAFGVCNYLTLYHSTSERRYLDRAQSLVADVDRVLGRRRGYRIGQAPDRDGQYFHYLVMWIYALTELAKVCPSYHERAVQLVKDIHPHFVERGAGVLWKMKEDLSGPYPGYPGYSGLDMFGGYVVYRLADEHALSAEIADMEQLISRTYKGFRASQDLGLGMSLWLAHFFPDEEWARVVRQRSLDILGMMWRDHDDQSGYFIRDAVFEPDQKFAFTNYGVSLGLQATGQWTDRAQKLNTFFDTYRHHDEYDTDAITHVMACTSHFPGVMIRGGVLLQQ